MSTAAAKRRQDGKNFLKSWMRLFRRMNGSVQPRLNQRFLSSRGQFLCNLPYVKCRAEPTPASAIVCKTLKLCPWDQSLHYSPQKKNTRLFRRVLTWSGRRDSDSRHPPWQGGTLPLSYYRIAHLQKRFYHNGFCLSTLLSKKGDFLFFPWQDRRLLSE